MGDDMNITRLITAAAMSFGLLGGIGATAGPAAASTTPVAVYSNNSGWNAFAGYPAHMVKPRTLYLGADYGIYSLSWSHWTTTAYGYGTLKACGGAYGPCVIYTVSVTLEHVKVHDGIRYFATMEIRGHGTMWLVMNGYGNWIQI
jgi:hypothetical protein